MSRRLDKSRGRSFTEIGEILGMTESQVELVYTKAMTKLRAENPENGRYLLDQMKTEGRGYAHRVASKPSCDLRSSPDVLEIENMSTEPPHEELPEEIFE